MTDHSETKCPSCGQLLRIPNNKGGITMVCPSCGHKIQSDFKFGGVKHNTRKNVFITIFEMPGRVIDYIGRFFGGRY